MPYPDLPPDFKQKHNSVWVDIDPKLFDPVRAHEIYNETWTSSNTPPNAASTRSA